MTTTHKMEYETMECKPQPFPCLYNNEYMNIGVDEWIDTVNRKVSFGVSKIGRYTKSVYACSVDAVLSILMVDEASFKRDIALFMNGTLDSSTYISVLHSKLTTNYLSFKNHCLRYGIHSKAISNVRDDLYTTMIDFIDTDVRDQYLEIIHAVLSNASDIMMCSCMQMMTVA